MTRRILDDIWDAGRKKEINEWLENFGNHSDKHEQKEPFTYLTPGPKEKNDIILEAKDLKIVD